MAGITAFQSSFASRGVEDLGFNSSHRRDTEMFSPSILESQVNDLGFGAEKIEFVHVSSLLAGEISIDQNIRGGQTAYDTGVGFWLGRDGSTAKFSIGDSSGNKMTWDGSTLTVTGTLTATSGSIGGFDIGSDYIRDVANSFGLASTVTGGDDVRFWAGNTFANRATAPLRITEAGALVSTSATITGAITASSGSITGAFSVLAALTVGAAGTFSSGQTAYDTGVGWWMEYNAGTPRFSFGDSAGSKITFDGVTLSVPGPSTLGGFNVGSDYIRDAANSFGLASTVTGGDDVRFWAGDTFANRATAPARITESGAATFTSISITSGDLTASFLNANSVDTAELVDLAVETAKLNDLAVTTGKIALLAVQTAQIDALAVTTAKIDNLAVTNAKINDLAVDKLTAGTISSKSIVLAVAAGTGDVEIRSGIASGDFANAGAASGFILGVDDSDGDTAKFFIGSGTQYLSWDGSTLSIVGSFTATSGSIGGFNIGSDYIRDAANSFGLASTVTGGDDVRFWAGDTFANRATAPFRVTEAGAVTATSITLSTNVVISGLQAGSSVDGQYLAALSVGTASIAALAVTDAKINDLAVSKLTAGTITSKSINLTVADGTGDVEIRSGIATGDFSNAGAASGFIIGVDDSDANKAKFYFGSSTQYISYDGSTLSIVGSFTASSGTIGGFDIGSDYIRDAANSFGLASTVSGGDDVRFWAGDTFANRATAPFRVTEAGVVTATSIAISTSSSTIAGTALVNGSVASNVQSRAEKLFRSHVFIGTANDTLSGALQAGGSNGGVTVRPVNTRIGTNAAVDNAYGRLYSKELGYKNGFTETDWDYDFEFDINVVFESTTTQDIFLGLASGDDAGNRAPLWNDVPNDGTSTARHIGFYIDDGTIYASNADGTTQTRTDVSAGITMTDKNHFKFVWDNGTNIKFYINDTLVATHSTNLPTGTTNKPILLVNVTNSTTAERQIWIGNNIQLIGDISV